MMNKLQLGNIKKTWKLLVVLVLFSISIILTSCSDGPLERAGETIDDAVEDTGDAIKDVFD